MVGCGWGGVGVAEEGLGGDSGEVGSGWGEGRVAEEGYDVTGEAWKLTGEEWEVAKMG